MEPAQAIDDAGALITLVLLLPVSLLTLEMSQNMTNPNYDMTTALENGLFGIVEAVTPNIGLTLVVAAGLLALSIASNDSNRWR